MTRLAMVLVLAASGARGEELLLSDEAGRVSLSIVPWAGSDTRSVVQWRGLPVEPSSGIAIFERSSDPRRTQLMAVGAAAPFFIRSSSARALVKGSTASTWELLFGDRPPLLVVSQPGEVPRDTLEQAYRQTQGVPSGTKPRAEVEAALTRATVATQKACGSSPKLQVDWKAFDGRALPLAAVTVLAALATLCADADYRSAIAGLERLEVVPATGSDFELDRSKGALVLRLRHDAANPGVRALQMLRDTL